MRRLDAACVEKAFGARQLLFPVTSDFLLRRDNRSYDEGRVKLGHGVKAGDGFVCHR
jgi:hypothetical protein